MYSLKTILQNTLLFHHQKSLMQLILPVNYKQLILLMYSLLQKIKQMLMTQLTLLWTKRCLLVRLMLNLLVLKLILMRVLVSKPLLSRTQHSKCLRLGNKNLKQCDRVKEHLLMHNRGQGKDQTTRLLKSICMVHFQAIFLVVMVILKPLMIDRLQDQGKTLKHTKQRLTLDLLREFYPLRSISKHRLQISLVIGDSSVALQGQLTSLELKATCLRVKKEAKKVK